MLVKITKYVANIFGNKYSIKGMGAMPKPTVDIAIKIYIEK
jgi:hypothetical protein